MAIKFKRLTSLIKNLCTGAPWQSGHFEVWNQVLDFELSNSIDGPKFKQEEKPTVPMESYHWFVWSRQAEKNISEQLLVMD